MANSFVFNFDTLSKTLNRVLRYDYYGYPRDFIHQYQRGIEAVTRQDVMRTAVSVSTPKSLRLWRSAILRNSARLWQRWAFLSRRLI